MVTKKEAEKLERKLIDNTHRNGITFANITTGVPLTKGERREIIIKLKQYYGRRK